jgi:8-amino-7-oxononanoate synthase
VSPTRNKLFGLSGSDKQRIIDRIRNRNRNDKTSGTAFSHKLVTKTEEIPEEYYRLEHLPGLKQLQIQLAAADKLGIANPFFRMHEAVASSETIIGDRTYINYSSYNYLGLCGHPQISRCAKDAIDRYGTSASASRPVSGERPIHRELEHKLAEVHKTEGCVVFVSGHATNVTTIGCLFGKDDLILHDVLAHNSILQGAILSGAKRLTFPHNDYTALDKILEENRAKYKRVVIVIEGMYSMDGDIPQLDKFIEIKQRHKVFLMVDEAHSLGVLGDNGFGIKEHFGINSEDVDISMGTLSKTLSSCGGYVAGKNVLVENLKFNAPGFVYSVGIAPPAAAAALAALEIMIREPERTQRLRKLGKLFFDMAGEAGLNTGVCQGYAIIPVITGSSILSVKLSNVLLENGINVQPIIYPAVEERAARLRFFLCASHTETQIEQTIGILAKELKKLKHSPIFNLGKL